MKFCETCAHWTDREGWEQSFDGMKLCKRVRHKDAVDSDVFDHDNELSEAKAEVADVAFGEPETPETGTAEQKLRVAMDRVFGLEVAVVEDGSSYYAALLTRPTFGCVLHTDKPVT